VPKIGKLVDGKRKKPLAHSLRLKSAHRWIPFNTESLPTRESATAETTSINFDITVSRQSETSLVP